MKNSSTSVHQRLPGLALVAAAITVLLWSSAFVGVRAIGEDYSPGALTLGRQLAAVAVLTVVVVIASIRRGHTPQLPRGKVFLIVIGWGTAWFGLYNLALNTTSQLVDAGTTALLVNLAPILIGVFAGIFLNEGFPVRLMVGLAVAFSGVVTIASVTWTGHGSIVGVLLGIAAATLYASSATVQKYLLTRLDALTLTWLGCIAGAVAGLPFWPQLVAEAQHAPMAATMGMLYLGAFPTALAFLTWAYALSRTSAGRLAASTYSIPPLVVLLSWILLSEVPAALALVGGGICLVGVAIATFRRAPARQPAASPSSKAVQQLTHRTNTH